MRSREGANRYTIDLSKAKSLHLKGIATEKFSLLLFIVSYHVTRSALIGGKQSRVVSYLCTARSAGKG